MKKVLALVLSGLLMLSLVACQGNGGQGAQSAPEGSEPTSTGGTPEASGEEITLRFSWWGGDARHEATLEAIAAYEASHPGVKIEAEYSSFSGYYEKLITQLSSNSAPEIFQVDQGWVAELSGTGNAFADMSAYSDILDLSTIPETMMDDYCTIDGRVEVLPFGYNGTVFLYNKTLLADWCDDNGDLMLETWDDLIRIGEELHAKDPDSYMTTAITDGYIRYVLKPMLEQVTGKIDVQDDFTLGFDAAEMTRTFESLMQLFDNPVAQPYEEAILYDSMQNNPLWLNGNLGGIFLFFSNIDTEIAGLDYDYGVLGMPTFEDALVTGQECCPSLMVAINKNSDEATQAAAAEFLEWFLNSAEAAEILQTVRGVPASETALATLREKNVLSDLMAEAIDISNETLSLKNGAYEMNSTVLAVYAEYMEKVIYKMATPADAAEAMIADLEKVLGELDK